ncbi:MAG: gamma-glutamyl-gamma-aminobutyrate hydrolase family protein [Oscillospiraceae bacterium]|nr:gamma-glutamyl-gamma-aminobutyrate hydrolase family protein [Oscillospiraceae bacterium]
MFPRILISAATAKPDAALNYENAVRAAGGFPVVQYCPKVDLSFDALVLTGGGDVDPRLYGQEDRGSLPPDPARDRAELALVKAYLDAGKPILGICRGCQILNVALGGTLIQDLGQTGNLFHRRIETDKVHPVRAQESSLLHALYGPLFHVNSAHHQAVDVPGSGAVITARSEGGVAEALELPGRPVLGVQFHPERMTGAHLRPDCVDGAPLFAWFLAQCSNK